MLFSRLRLFAYLALISIAILFALTIISWQRVKLYKGLYFEELAVKESMLTK